VYGPRQDPYGESGVVAIFTGAAGDDRPVTVYGDGRQTRDYVHVDDVAGAFATAAAAQVTGVLNVATGVETSVLGLARALGVEVLHGPGRGGEVARSCLDPSAAADALGWRPRIVLSAGLSRVRTPLAV
jgi:UDP-glucose 4-epimerase